MALVHILKKLERTVVKNAPTIFTALGVSGTITTAYLASKASFVAQQRLTKEETLVYTHGADTLTKKEQVKIVWKLYIPTAISGAITIGCIIAGTKIETRRKAAAYSLLTVSEKAFTEYKDKVVEQIGPKKEQAIRDSVVQDKVKANPPAIVVGSGHVLCCELHTGRYFNSDVETIRKAQNTINAQMLRENDATLSDFYYLLGLPQTSYSSDIGWTSDKLLEVTFSAVMAEGDKPCLAFEYNYVKPF